MKLAYDEGYTNTFHGPETGPCITRLLKNRDPLGRVLDIDCGLDLRIDLSLSKVEDAKAWLYDELCSTADIRNFTCRS